MAGVTQTFSIYCENALYELSVYIAKEMLRKWRALRCNAVFSLSLLGILDLKLTQENNDRSFMLYTLI